METPVFIFTGFIDSGKTTLLRDTIESPDFTAYRNLIILCEEGDEEYDAAFLKRNRAFLEVVDNKEDLTDEFLESMYRKYTPDQVMIEYNGTWEMNQILDRRLPKNWAFNGIYSVVDTSTVEMYLGNMRQMFMEQFRESGLVIFNRCEKDVDRMRLRRIFKGFNPQVQLIFEDPDGEMYDPADDPLPFDINADVIEIEDIDYGIWYIDAMELPEHYLHKKLRFLAQVYKGKELPEGTFVPGRFIMTCCVNDIRFMGFECHYDGQIPYKQRDWVNVEVEFNYGYLPSAGQKAPILKLLKITAASKPEVDPVYFT